MRAAAWVRQLPSQVEKFGKDEAAWYCEWREPDGTRRCKSCGAGKAGKKAAEKMAERIRAELLTGTYDRTDGKGWGEFRDEYESRVLGGLAASSAKEAKNSLSHFERLLSLKGKTVAAVTADRIAEFVKDRRKERGKKPGSKVSPATINRDLRHVKAALRTAAEWGYLEKVPKIKFEREPQTLPRYITPEHFLAIYENCSVATLPNEMHVPAAEWWRALIFFAQMTGWRIGEILALRWDDVDLSKGTAITRARDNKGKRDEVTPLHPEVLEHIAPLKSFHPAVFPWEHDRKLLGTHFHAIQEAAGIDLPCRVTGRTGAELNALRDAAKRHKREFVQGDAHECTATCHKYGFHDERRAFATLNAASMSRDALKALMRHKSSLTTERYINFARQLNPAVANLHVPAVKRPAVATAAN